MIEITKVLTPSPYEWDAIIRGMRNPLNSWALSDSSIEYIEDEKTLITAPFAFHLGKHDLGLMRSLVKAGADHAKFMRMAIVYVDINAPLYWWKEFDTYKVGTVANSCSTMHTIMKKEFTKEDFSMEDLNPEIVETITGAFEELRKIYIEAVEDEAKRMVWRSLIQMLPSSFNQKRTVMLNYDVLRRMYFARKDHKLKEWREFCEWIFELPYFKEICLDEE